MTFGRHWAETVGGLWLIDNVVPLRPEEENVRLRQGFRHLIEWGDRGTCMRKDFCPLAKEPLLDALPKPP